MMDRRVKPECTSLLLRTSTFALVEPSLQLHMQTIPSQQQFSALTVLSPPCHAC